MGKIKNFSEGEEIVFSKPEEGLPTYPQKPYPGFAVGEPTCSAPDGENTGCDAWKRCSTQGEGPYSVVYKNLTKDTKNSCHCRLWHYRLKRKPDKYQPVDDPWVDMVESVAVDPQDISKGTRIRRYSHFVENARLPIKGGQVHTIEDYETEDVQSAASLSAVPSPEPEDVPSELSEPLEIRDERRPQVADGDPSPTNAAKRRTKRRK